MPPKSKKQPKNAFFFFMMDWKSDKERQGQRFSGLKEVSELCSEDWKTLPRANVEYYKAKEKEAKQKDKTDLSNKFNSQGITYQQIENEKREIESAIAREHNEIDSTTNALSADLDSLKSHCFFLVHTNVYCYWGGDRKVFIPAEVAISKFNLRDGLLDSYHVFPCPFTENGKIPLGYKHEVRVNTETVHSIPDPAEFDQVEYDWGRIRADVRKFLQPNPGADIPPLYTIEGDDSNINCHQTAVKNFFDSVANGSDENYRVYSISLLFYKLYLACQKVAESMFGDIERAFPVEGVAHSQLLRDVYNFSSGIACSFHETTEHYHNCSLSFVKRWVFVISEFCCKALKIEMIPGRHCLITANISSSGQGFGSQSTSRSEMMPNSPSSHSYSSQSCAVAPNSVDDDGWSKVPSRAKNSSLENRVESRQMGAWGTDSRGQQQAGAWGSASRGQGSRSQNEEVLVVDHSRALDPHEARVYKTGQSPNVVSELKQNYAEPSVRRPTTHGRGELMARALQLSSPGSSYSSEDFPEIGASKPGRLAKPMTSGWGRGYLKQ